MNLSKQLDLLINHPPLKAHWAYEYLNIFKNFNIASNTDSSIDFKVLM